MNGKSFRRAIFYDVGFEKMRVSRKHFEPFGVAFRKKERMIEIFRNPTRNKFNPAEINHEALVIKFIAGKGQCERPIVAVDKAAMPRVAVLNVPDRNIRVNLFTGMHAFLSCGTAFRLRENFLGVSAESRLHGGMDKEIYHADVWFEGHVQGVGFRFQTMKVAREYEVSGTVRNLADGRVLLHAEGDEREVSDFVDAVSLEMKSFIRSVEKRHYLAPPCERGFNIAH